MNNFPMLLVIAGAILIAIGLLWQVGSIFGLGRLPGDIVIERDNLRIYFPIATSIILSIILTVVFFFIRVR
jgi:hypothetical protein